MILELSLLSSGVSVASLLVDSKLTVEEALSHLLLELEALDFNSGDLKLRGITGQLSWQIGEQLLDGQFSWQKPGLGSARLTGHFSAASNGGRVAARYSGEEQDQVLEASLDFERREQGIYFPELLVLLGDQQLGGSGCLQTEDKQSLHLLMSSDFIDLGKLESMIPNDSVKGMDGGNNFPLEINLKLTVQELHAAGAIVRDADISLGQHPDCASLRD